MYKKHSKITGTKTVSNRWTGLHSHLPFRYIIEKKIASYIVSKVEKAKIYSGLKVNVQWRSNLRCPQNVFITLSGAKESSVWRYRVLAYKGAHGGLGR